MENRTTIQVSEDVRKKLKVLASKRDASYEELLGEMINVFNELDRTKTIISVPKLLASKVNENIKKGTDMSSVSEYVTFLLRLALSEEGPLHKTDEQKIKGRLKTLGYL